MRTKRLFAICIAVCGLALAARADAGAIYGGGNEFNLGEGIDYTIHTDGKLGALSEGDISYVFFDDHEGYEGFGTITLPADGSLTATKAGLFFNFAAETTVVVSGSNGGETATACYGSACGGSIGEYFSDYGLSSFTAESGIVRIAGAAPEPATWLLMITGFGLVGGSLRAARALRFRLA